MRKALDTVYGAALAGACTAMAVIASMVFVQVLGRVIDIGLGMIGIGRLGISIPSLAEIGGFLFVAAAFLALPSTLRAAGHVRVTLLLRFFGPLGNRVLAALALMFAVALAGFATWHSLLHVIDAYQSGTVSYGLVAIPLWIPKSVMVIGLGIFTVALIDELVAALRGEDPAFRAAERAREEEGAQ